MDWIIRPVTETDIPQLLAIYAPYVTDTVITFETAVPTLEEFTARILGIQASYHYLVCEAQGTLLGYAYASRHRPRDAYRYSVETSVYVAQEHHRLGIGYALYTQLLSQLTAGNFYSAYAAITYPNPPSQALHQKLGFTQVGLFHNVGYKQDSWLDVLWLEKQLKPYDTPVS